VAISRGSAATRSASRILASILKRPRSRIDMQIAIMTSDKGGNFGDVYRRFAIWELAHAYQKHLHKPPNTTNTGRFVKLCESVFPLFEIETAGLDQAVLRRTSSVG
jgi:hypothetical protein